jgi:DNA-binding NarL/FixJ family response regulator
MVPLPAFKKPNTIEGTKMGAAISMAADLPVRRVRILIADDHPSIRKAIRLTLQEQPSFEICAVVEDGLEAVDKASKLKPDVAILNITMPHLNGLEAARKIKAERPETAIVILSSHADQEFIAIAKEIGVHAYVSKMRAGQELMKAVQAALRDEEYYIME